MKILKFKSKTSDEYKNYANDFMPNRKVQWTSIYYQASPIITLPDVFSVIEFGGGRDTTRALSRHMGIEHIDVDVLDRFFPDETSSISDYPFKGKRYDMVCSFQCLEHNPFEDLDTLIPHMLKFSKKYLYISVPYRGYNISCFLNIKLPKICFTKHLSIVPNWATYYKVNLQKIHEDVKKHPERFHHHHWWEVGMKGLPRNAFVKKIEGYGLKRISVFHNPFMPFHLFCLFEKHSPPTPT